MVGAAMYTGAMAELAQQWLTGHLGDDLDAVLDHGWRWCCADYGRVAARVAAGVVAAGRQGLSQSVAGQPSAAGDELVERGVSIALADGLARARRGARAPR